MQLISTSGASFLVRYRVFLVAVGACAVSVVPRGDGEVLRWAGNGLLLAGLLLRTWAAGVICKNSTVARDGPYVFWRHPLYTGSMLVGLGLACLSGVWWLPWLAGPALAWFLDRLMRQEEARMFRWAAAADVQDFLATRGRWIPRAVDCGLAEVRSGWSWRRCVGSNGEWQAWTGIGLLWLIRSG